MSRTRALTEIWHGSAYVGDSQTNNVAEYTGLLLGLKAIAVLLDIQFDFLFHIKEIEDLKISRPYPPPPHLVLLYLTR